MKRIVYIVLIVTFCLRVDVAFSQNPPYTITAYIDSNIIRTDDYSALHSISYAGQGMRWMFDRRTDDWEYLNAYLFDVGFDDSITTEVQVNPEFGSSSNAMIEACKYAFIIGQLPAFLRSETQKIWIHQGDESFGGGFNGVLIHTGGSPNYESLGILEEVLFHEATHTALDPLYASDPGWISAQNSDIGFISTYAASSPMIEDIAESFLAWFMVRQCERRLSGSDSITIAQTIPNRIAFFDSLNVEMYPLCINGTLSNVNEYDIHSIDVYPNPVKDNFSLDVPSVLIGKYYGIYNVSGQCVVVGIIESNNNIINVHYLTTGVYFLNVGQEGFQTRKIIKL
ncbi:MAG: T9SS type A sorting domain-containing protein [Bacteroidota bacterium]